MILLALDPAIATGWAWGGKSTPPQFGCWRLPGFDDAHLARSFASIYTSVRRVVVANKVEGFIIEAPLHLAQKSSHTERCLTMLSGAAQAGAINGGARFVSIVAPQSWRKVVLGHGFPENPKEKAIRFCTRQGWYVDNDNAADALCLLRWGHLTL